MEMKRIFYRDTWACFHWWPTGKNGRARFCYADLPLALIEKYNGFAGRELVDLYEKCAIVLFEKFGSKNKYWMMVNEINTIWYNPLDAGIRDLGGNPLQVIFQGAHHQFLASAKAVIHFHRLCPKGQIGMKLGYYPETMKRYLERNGVRLAVEKGDADFFEPAI